MEIAKFEIEMDGKQAAKHRTALTVLKPSVGLYVLGNEDTLSLSWELCIQYAGDTAVKLTALLEILEDNKLVVEADCEQIRKGQILFYEVCKQLEKVQRRIKARKSPHDQAIEEISKE
jgi:hypothetical protein